MPSLFRIDKNSITAECLNQAKIVELPCFEDMIFQNRDDADDSSVNIIENSEIDAIDEKQKQLRQIEQQVEQAREQARQMVSQAEQEASRLKDDAIKNGYDEGYSQAMASARQEQEQAQQRVENAIMALKSAREDVFAQVEDSVVDLSLFIAEHIISIELDKSDEAFLNIVRNTLSKVQNQSNMVVKVCKAEYERIFSNQNSEIVQELRNSGVEVKQDMSLKSGECVVETEYGNISSGIKTQLSRLGSAMRDSITEQ